MTASNSSAALFGSSAVIFIPTPLRVCGNCNFWIGPRVRNGRHGYAAFEGVVGNCCNRTRQAETPEHCSSDATPLSSPDCPLWEDGLDGSISAAEGAAR